MWFPGGQYMVSMGTPHDFNVDTMLFPDVQVGDHYMVSTWKPHGVCMGTMLCPHGEHNVKTTGFQVDTTLSLCEHYKVLRWTPYGFHVDTT